MPRTDIDLRDTQGKTALYRAVEEALNDQSQLKYDTVVDLLKKRAQLSFDKGNNKSVYKLIDKYSFPQQAQLFDNIPEIKDPFIVFKQHGVEIPNILMTGRSLSLGYLEQSIKHCAPLPISYRTRVAAEALVELGNSTHAGRYIGTQNNSIQER